MISYFKIVKEIIDSHISAISSERGIPKNDIYNDIVNYIKQNSSEWRSNARPNIRYEDPICRIAYIYNIVPVNANLIEHVFNSTPEIINYFDNVHDTKGEVGICAFGGGPGTELLGLAKWICKRKLDKQLELNFILLDKVKEWIDSLRAIRNHIYMNFESCIGTDRGKWPLRISHEFCNIDIADTSNYANFGTIFNQDIYILSYIISEVFDDNPDLIDFISIMSRQAPVGSKFIFIDRRGSRWEDYIREIASKAGITLSNFRESSRAMSRDEQVSDLGQIYFDVNWYPRTRWDSLWVVGTK